LEGLGPHPSPLDAVAYSIVVLAVSGITVGVIWARTKNLFALMLIHAAGDLLPTSAASSGRGFERHLAALVRFTVANFVTVDSSTVQAGDT
jgi:membrane protease YdiL (CAAX protease family)